MRVARAFAATHPPERAAGHEGRASSSMAATVGASLPSQPSGLTHHVQNFGTFVLHGDTIFTAAEPSISVLIGMPGQARRPHVFTRVFVPGGLLLGHAPGYATNCGVQVQPSRRRAVDRNIQNLPKDVSTKDTSSARFLSGMFKKLDRGASKREPYVRTPFRWTAGAPAPGV